MLPTQYGGPRCRNGCRNGLVVTKQGALCGSDRRRAWVPLPQDTISFLTAHAEAHEEALEVRGPSRHYF